MKVLVYLLYKFSAKEKDEEKIEDLVLQLHKTKTKHDITSCKKETLHE